MPFTINTSRLKLIAISALILVFVGVALALANRARQFSPEALAIASQSSLPAFTLTTSRKLMPAKEREILVSTQQRFQRSDGTYKLVQTIFAPDGTKQHVQTLFGYTGLGVFRLEEEQKRLAFTGPLVAAEPGDVEQALRSSKFFTREESVAGISALVWRKPSRAKGDFVEEYHAASLGGLLIKMVKVSARGRETIEPTSIQMGEPAQSLFDELLSYQADYTAYEKKVAEAERNRPETALLMRELLQRMRQAKP